MGMQGIDQLVEQLMEEWKVPGVALGIIRDGKTVHAQGYGVRSLATGEAVTPETVFPIASLTKNFTSLSIGILADEGKIDLDAPVRRYLPDFQLQDEVATLRCSLRDLLSHRTGLPRHDYVWYGKSGWTRQDVIERLRYLEPSKDFRTTGQYQNMTYLTAGYVAGLVAGDGWEALAQERILDPLGMNNTMFTLRQVLEASNRAEPYAEVDGEMISLVPYDTDLIGPAGGMYSTLNDLLTYLQVHLNKGQHEGTTIISAEMLKQMHSPHIPLKMRLSDYTEMPVSTYGLGWQIEPYRGVHLIHHGGNINGFTTLMAFLPEEQIGMVILVNKNVTALHRVLSYCLIDHLLGFEQTDWSAREQEVRDRMTATMESDQAKRLEARVADTAPAHELAAYAGEYSHPAYGTLNVRLTEKGELEGQLGSFTLLMEHFHYDTFMSALDFVHSKVPMTLTFHTGADGRIEHVTAPLEPAPGVAPIRFCRVD